MGIRRGLLLWLGLFAVYAVTLGIDTAPHHRYAGDEPHYLLAAESIVSDGDLDVRDEYRDGDGRVFSDGRLRPHAKLTQGRLHEPLSAGLALAIAPAYALGGPRAVELELAALTALAFVLAIALARRLVPEPWASTAPLVCAVSPAALGCATAIYPDAPAALVLAAATLTALRCRRAPRARTAIATGALLALLPWLGAKYLPAGVVVLLVQWRWLARRGRGFHGLLGAEALFASLVACVTVNGTLYGGLTPYAATLPGAAPGELATGDLAGRLPRLLSLWIDRGQGILRWAPLFALAFLAGWLLWRSRRDRVARALPERADVEAAASLLVAVAGAQALTAALATATVSGPWFPGRHLVAALPVLAALSAWGLRHARPVGAALAALTALAGAWMCILLLVDGGAWSQPPGEVPWGPLDRLFPDFAAGPTYSTVVAGVLAAALAALAVHERRRARRTGALALRA